MVSIQAEQTQEYYLNNRRAQLFVVCVISFGAFMGPITLATVNVALPTIAHALNAKASLIGWIPTIFLLGSISLMLPFSKLADNIGRKNIYVSGMIINTLGTIAATFAQDIYWLIACRFIQGIASAMIFGCSMAILTSVFPPKQRGLPLGINAFALYAGLATAPLLGGWATEYLGWRSVFWVQIPALLILIIAALQIRGEWKNPKPGKFDWKGTVIFGFWTLGLVVGLSGLPDPAHIVIFIAGIAALIWFATHESKTENPLVRLSLFSEHKSFTIALIATLFMYAAAYPVSIITSMYLQYIKDMPPSQAGNIMLLQAIAMAPLAPIAGKLSDKLNAGVIAAIGCAIACISFFLYATVGELTPVMVVSIAMLGLGVGYGLFTTPNNNIAMHSIPQKELGAAAALLNLARTTGNTIGMGVVTLFITYFIGSKPITDEHHPELLLTVNLSMKMAAVYCLITFCLILIIKIKQRHQQQKF